MDTVLYGFLNTQNCYSCDASLDLPHSLDRMKCRWLNHVAATPPLTARDTKGAIASEPAASSPRGPPRGPPKVADKATEPQVKEMHSLQLKVTVHSTAIVRSQLPLPLAHFYMHFTVL